MSLVASSCEDCGGRLGTDGLCHRCLAEGLKAGSGTSDGDWLPEISGYQLLEEIGRGGMGRVYRAVQLDLRREVALKLVLDGRLAGDEVRRRFLLEAECAAQLNHFAIVPIHDSGEEGGFLYLTCRLLRGGNLSENLDRYLPRASKDDFSDRQKKIAQLVGRIADALQYGHQHGVIHRDVKSSNILLDEHGNAFLADFGLARYRNESSDEVRLTLTNQLVGSPGYMAPEQLNERTLSLSADVYSLGVVLFELLTGELPFQESPLPRLLEQVRTQEVRFPDSSRELDPALMAICLKCLRKEPDARYHSAGQLKEDLLRYLRNEPVVARPITRVQHGVLWARRHPVPSLLLSLLFIAGVIVVGTFFSNVQLQKEKLRITEEAERASRHRLASEWIAHAEELCRKGDIGLALPMFDEAMRTTAIDAPSLNRAAARQRAAWAPAVREILEYSDDGPAQIAVSPDGLRYCSWDGGRSCALWERKSDMGNYESRAFHTSSGISSAAFSPDGESLIVVSRSEAMLVDTNDLSVRFRTSRVAPDGESLQKMIVSNAQFSPDGAIVVIAFSHRPAQLRKVSNFALIGEIPLPPLHKNRGEVRTITFDDSLVLIAYGGGLVVHDLRDDQTSTRIAAERIDDLAIHPSGELVAIADIDARVRLLALPTLTLLDTVQHVGRATAVEFSPDGTKLVTASRDRTSHVWNVVDGTKLVSRRFQRHPAAVTHCVWAPAFPGFVTACEDGFVRFYSEPFLKADFVTKLDGSPPFSLHPSANGYVGGTTRGDIIRFDAPKPSPAGLDTEAESRVIRIDPETDDLVALADWGTAARGVQRWREDQRILSITPDPAPARRTMGLSRDGKLACRGTPDGTIEIWDTESGETLVKNRISEEDIPLTRVSGSIDAPVVALSTRSQTLHLYRPGGGEITASRTFLDTVSTLEFSPDGESLALGFSTGRVRMVSVETLGDLSTFPGQSKHTNQVLVVEFNADGSLLASGSMDRSVYVYRVADGVVVSGPLEHRDYVWALAFSDDSETLATSGQEYAVRFFDLQTSLQLGPPIFQTAWINALVFRDEGLLGIGNDNRFRHIDLPPLP